MKKNRPVSIVRSFIVATLNTNHNHTNTLKEDNIQSINIGKFRGLRKQGKKSMQNLVIFLV